MTATATRTARSRSRSTTMTAAELKSAREHMGLTTRWLSARLGVTERTLQRWEDGDQPIREQRATEVRNLIAHTDQVVADLATSLRSAPRKERVLQTFRTDGTADHGALTDPTTSSHDSAPLPAAWHRIVCARAAAQVAGTTTIYATDAE